MANFTDNSTLSDVVKLKNFLEDMADKDDRRYFFDDGFPRSNDIRQDALASLEVLAQFFADKHRELEQRQLGKYIVSQDGKLVNRASAVPIPLHEPVFILRAKDRHARPALRYYLFIIREFYVEAKVHHELVKSRITEFLKFSTENEHLCKDSDTDLACDFRRSRAREAFLSQDSELTLGNSWQDPKYAYSAGKIICRDTGVAIPNEEPIFILRAKDVCAIQTLEFYRDTCTDRTQRNIVSERINDFIVFSRKYPKNMNPKNMKTPDTSAAELNSFFEAIYK